jgi:peptidoglycan LD-endopeptidase LytH
MRGASEAPRSVPIFGTRRRIRGENLEIIRRPGGPSLARPPPPRDDISYVYVASTGESLRRRAFGVRAASPSGAGAARPGVSGTLEYAREAQCLPKCMVISRTGGRLVLLVVAGVFGLQGIVGTGPAEALRKPVALDSAPVTSEEGSGEGLLIPVVGISGDALRDSWGAPRSGGRAHQAIDIPAERGAPVVAVVDGVVLKLFESRAGGTTLYLTDHDRELLYYYAHLDGYAEGLHEGMTVQRGTILGFVGSTGNAPDHFPHLHFSIERLPETGEWWKGEPINPYPILIGEASR